MPQIDLDRPYSMQFAEVQKYDNYGKRITRTMQTRPRLEHRYESIQQETISYQEGRWV